MDAEGTPSPSHRGSPPPQYVQSWNTWSIKFRPKENVTTLKSTWKGSGNDAPVSWVTVMCVTLHSNLDRRHLYVPPRWWRRWRRYNSPRDDKTFTFCLQHGRQDPWPKRLFLMSSPWERARTPHQGHSTWSLTHFQLFTSHLMNYALWFWQAIYRFIEVEAFSLKSNVNL